MMFGTTRGNVRTGCRIVAVASSLAAGFALTGCPMGANPQTGKPTSSSSPQPLTEDQAETRTQLVEAGVSDGEIAFSWDLLRAVSTESPTANTFLSPFSISQALLVAANGTTGDTQKRFLKTVGLPPLDMRQVDVQKKELLGLLEPPQVKDRTGKDVPAYEWTMANAIWSRHAPKPHFAEYCGIYLSAQAFPLTNATAINSWAYKYTHGRISTIVDDLLVQDADLILTNAVYFKGEWVYPFRAEDTHREPFHLPGGTVRQQPFLHGAFDKLDWYAGKNYEAVSIPYRGDMIMIVLLPDTNTAPQQLLGSLSAAEWNTMRKGMKETAIDLALPKFTFDYGVPLKNTLARLGMPLEGDFSPIADILSRAEIYAVIQKTFIRVDEEGTEAAAVSMVMVPGGAAPPTPPPAHPFIVDRPFLCAIVHRDTGTILFTGLINDPVPVKEPN